MFISREEKERLVIDLYYNQGKTMREIAKEPRVSPKYISAALKKEEKRIIVSLLITRSNLLLLHAPPEPMNCMSSVRLSTCIKKDSS
jgi:DNA-binding transcriptional regulator LsrR (DeoR family)